LQPFFDKLHSLRNKKEKLLQEDALLTAQEAIQKIQKLPQKYQKHLNEYIITEHVLYVGALFPEMSKTEILNEVFLYYKQDKGTAQEQDYKKFKKENK